jgi:hypothetical protein
MGRTFNATSTKRITRQNSHHSVCLSFLFFSLPEFNVDILFFFGVDRYNERTYKIEDIDFRKTPHDKFTPHGEKEPISFFDYYKKKGIKLRDMNQPLLVSSTKDGGKIYLMPETCVFSDMYFPSYLHFLFLFQFSCLFSFSKSILLISVFLGVVK